MREDGPDIFGSECRDLWMIRMQIRMDTPPNRLKRRLGERETEACMRLRKVYGIRYRPGGTFFGDRELNKSCERDAAQRVGGGKRP